MAHNYLVRCVFLFLIKLQSTYDNTIQKIIQETVFLC